VLDLPVASAGPAQGTQPPAPRRFEGRRALLVEDNRVNQALALALLKKLGFTVDVAENGRSAIEQVLGALTPYDIVFMDLQMPEMDGLEATRLIRARYEPEALPIVALTANAFEQDRERCLEAGMNDYIAKPMRLEWVAEVVHQVLSGARAG
jgi:CheY-like chemotaxis protein